MSYRFRVDDKSVTRGARRIAARQIDHALAVLDASPMPGAEDIHDMRTTVKKLRGLVGLLRPGVPGARRDDRVLRDAGRAISARRDSEVMLATLNVLAPDGLPDLRGALGRVHTNANAEGTRDAGLATYRAVLVTLRGRSRGWKLTDKDTVVLRRGIEDTFGAARRAWRTARDAPTASNLHEARKQIKAHGYHARLMEPVWPTLMTPYRTAAEELGETLGLINDLSMFVARLARLDLPPATRAEARERAEARHDELMAVAVPQADRLLLAEQTLALARRWMGWWAIWRAEA